MTCKERLEAYLMQQRVPFEVERHRTAYTAREIAASEHIPSKLVAKAVMIFADGEMTMLVLPATYQVDLDQVRKLLGTKFVRMAEEPEFASFFLDCEIGAMPPFGNLYDIPVYVDTHLTEDALIVFPAGTHTETMSVHYQDFDRVVKPIVGKFAAPRVMFAS
jgi:Ala-tRNA(Pro) deacylase